MNEKIDGIDIAELIKKDKVIHIAYDNGFADGKKQAITSVIEIIDKLKEHIKRSFCDSSSQVYCDVCHYQQQILDELKSELKGALE